jgi:hypothetical protein
MKGLAGGRVVLVDDDASEAMPIIKALSQANVPVTYFDGTQAELPRATRRLRGVRLAILDMDLGVGGSPENKASTLVGALGQIVSPDNGPYGILIWTKHPELRDLVTRYIYERSDVPNPVFVVMLHKSSFSRVSKAGSPARFSIRKLSRELVRELAENSPLECLQVWEGICFQAATNVTNELAEFADAVAPDLKEWKKAWQDEALRLLLTIGKASAEKNLSAENCLLSIYLALNPLQSDRMDLLAGEMKDDLSTHVTRIMASTGGSKTERKAKVNSMLHLGSHQLDEFSPGNTYVFGTTNRPAYLPTLDDILVGAVEGDGPKGAANLNVLRTNAKLCAVEITPLCDHAQGKMGLSKIITGFVLPCDFEKSAKRQASYLKRVGPMFLPKTRVIPSGAYSMFLDARFVVATKPSHVRALKAIVRVRPQLLADVQSWAAYQAARQGVMLLV